MVTSSTSGSCSHNRSISMLEAVYTFGKLKGVSGRQDFLFGVRLSRLKESNRDGLATREVVRLLHPCPWAPANFQPPSPPYRHQKSMRSNIAAEPLSCRALHGPHGRRSLN